MSIESEQATVYRGGGRRWFTKQAAARAEARTKIKQRCECDQGDHVTPGYSCYYHENLERYQEIVDRLARVYLREGQG